MTQINYKNYIPNDNTDNHNNDLNFQTIILNKRWYSKLTKWSLSQFCSLIVSIIKLNTIVYFLIFLSLSQFHYSMYSCFSKYSIHSTHMYLCKSTPNTEVNFFLKDCIFFGIGTVTKSWNCVSTGFLFPGILMWVVWGRRGTNWGHVAGSGKHDWLGLQTDWAYRLPDLEAACMASRCSVFHPIYYIYISLHIFFSCIVTSIKYTGWLSGTFNDYLSTSLATQWVAAPWVIPIHSCQMCMSTCVPVFLPAYLPIWL